MSKSIINVKTDNVTIRDVGVNNIQKYVWNVYADSSKEKLIETVESTKDTAMLTKKYKSNTLYYIENRVVTDYGYSKPSVLKSFTVDQIPDNFIYDHIPQYPPRIDINVFANDDGKNVVNTGSILVYLGVRDYSVTEDSIIRMDVFITDGNGKVVFREEYREVPKYLILHAGLEHRENYIIHVSCTNEANVSSPLYSMPVVAYNNYNLGVVFTDTGIKFGGTGKVKIWYTSLNAGVFEEKNVEINAGEELSYTVLGGEKPKFIKWIVNDQVGFLSVNRDFKKYKKGLPHGLPYPFGN